MMASKTGDIFSTWLILTVIITLSVISAKGSKCKQGEHLGCGSALGSPCGEDVCNIEKTAPLMCTMECQERCLCDKGLYRRLTDKKCVPKSECKS
ncbi:hypothetical protein MRX96_048335 [Rhipicephalus microplus]